MSENVARKELSIAALERDKPNFERLAEVLRKATGIHLPYSDKNKTLMSSRLLPILRDRGLSSYGEYLRVLEEGDKGVFEQFVSRMTTNTTHFFRESAHFDYLAKIVKPLAAQKKSSDPDLRIWCSAASTGQEPYGILMTTLEAGVRDLKLLATDIDTKVLAEATEAQYTLNQIEGVPSPLRFKYFEKHKTEEGERYHVRDEFVRQIRFAQMNILDEPYPFQKPFDIIFCRNVLIYFRQQDIDIVIRNHVSALAVGGYLFVGHSESGTVKDPRIKNIQHAVYQKVKP